MILHKEPLQVVFKNVFQHDSFEKPENNFAKCFIGIIENETSDFDEARVVFDRYEKNSLKSNTRITCTKEYSSVHYKVSDATRIEHLETKNFLSSIDTIQELTKYLSRKLSSHFTKDFVIVYDKTVQCSPTL